MTCYKTNIQKSITFLDANKKLEEQEIKKIIPFTVASKGIRYLGINLTMEGKELYIENFKILSK